MCRIIPLKTFASNHNLGNAKVGDVIDFPNFRSTAISKEGALWFSGTNAKPMKYIIEIEAPAGTKGAYLAPIKTGFFGGGGQGHAHPHFGENYAKEICRDEDFKCVAVAVPHAKKGEQIVLVSNKPMLERKDFIDYVSKNGLSELYVPAILLIREDFPVFATGKADKVTLKKWAIEQIKE